MPDSLKKPKKIASSLQALGISLDASRVDPDCHGVIFSFFSGAGFMDLGFERAGFVPLMVNEYHRPFLAAYQHSRARLGITPPPLGYLGGSVEMLQWGPGKSWLRDRITEARALGKPVGFVGGPPCPDFSNAGKHRGKDGEHGRLTKTYVDLIRAQQPDFFVFENVKGLLRNHPEHLYEIEQQLGAAGYRFATRLANSLEYGVPQDRERVVIIGFHRSLYERAGQPVPRRYRLDDAVWQDELSHKMEQIGRLSWPKTSPFGADPELGCPEGLPRELTVEYWFQQNQVEHHPNAHKRFQPRQGMARMLQVQEGDVSRKSFKRLHRWRYSATAAYGNNEVHLHPTQVRRLSVAEALAIQSMPRDFELPDDMTLSDLFKTVGNGVPFLMAYGIARSVARQLTALRPPVARACDEGQGQGPLPAPPLPREVHGGQEATASAVASLLTPC